MIYDATTVLARYVQAAHTGAARKPLHGSGSPGRAAVLPAEEVTTPAGPACSGEGDAGPAGDSREGGRP